jgi:hypothetical protein
MNARQARGIRTRLQNILDSSRIYPRRGTAVDTVSLAMFLRMCELHETICLLATKKRYRDAVILARTLLEAAISLYWLTNKDVEYRFDRYLYVLGKVHKDNIAVVEKYYGHKHTSTKAERELVRETEKLFKHFGKQWNDVKISQMAEENDSFETLPGGAPVNLAIQYDLFYWWFSLLAHPSIEAIQNFVPLTGKPFNTRRAPSPRRTLQEDQVVVLATTWLFMIASRIDTALDLKQDKAIHKTLAKIKEVS